MYNDANDGRRCFCACNAGKSSIWYISLAANSRTDSTELVTVEFSSIFKLLWYRVNAVLVPSRE